MTHQNARSISSSSIEELTLALDQLIHNHFHPSLAIAFSSPTFPFEKAIALLADRNIALVGCTTSGEIYDEEIVDDSFSVVFFEIDPQLFSVVQLQHADVDAYQTGIELGNIAMELFENPGIIVFISGVKVVGDAPVAGIRDHIEGEIPIFGGLAGDNLQHKATYSFTHEQITDFGLSAVILDTDHVRMESFAVSGWRPLGKTHMITKSEKNIIYEIDNQPALDLFLNYFGNIDYQLSHGKSLFSIAGQYPLKIFGENGNDYLRSLLIYDTENRALIAAGKMREGARFKFCPPPDFSVVNQTIQEFETFGKDTSDLDALLMVSCKGRHTSFGPMLDEEVESIYRIWEVPTIGFLSNGEIGSSTPNGICEFHNVTCSVLGIKIR